MTGTQRSPGRLFGIEALRGIAATAVVLSHAARHVDRARPAPGLIYIFQPGHAGVDLFFVISGFIILFVHRADIGRPGRLAHYAGRRFTRVLPLYWIALALTIAMGVAGGHGLPSPGMLAWSATLLPSVREPLLGIAWTLQCEAVFYGVFAMLIVSRNTGLVLLAAWLCWILAAMGGHLSAGVPGALCGMFGVEFFLGMAAAQALHAGMVTRPRVVAGIGLVAFGAALVLEGAGVLNGFGIAARFVYGVSAAFIVMGVAAADAAGRSRVPAWLRGLGSASYATYLFQFVFIGILWKLFGATGLERLPNLVLFLALAGTAVAGGIAMGRLIEKPLLRAIRSRGRTPVLSPG